MNARFLCAVTLAGLSIAAPAQAGAAQFHVVYDATIIDGADADDLFGLAGQDIGGLGIRADVTYLTSVAGTRTTGRTSDEVAGGEAFGTDPVISSAVFTIGARSFAFSPSYYGDVYTSADYLDAYGYDLLGNAFQTFMLPDAVGPANLELPFSGTGVGDAGGRTTQYSFVAIGGDLIDFNATSVTMSAVPEPATWAIMLVGFGAAGNMMRRTRRRVAVLA